MESVSDIYSNGSGEERLSTSIQLAGLFITATKGNVNGLVLAAQKGKGLSTAIRFIQGSGEKAKEISINLPDNFKEVKSCGKA